MAKTEQVVGHIILTLRAERTAKDVIEAECVELGVPSFGSTLDDALQNVANATVAYLDALTAEGELKRVLRENGLKIIPGPPAKAPKRKRVSARTDEVVTPRAFPVERMAAVG